MSADTLNSYIHINTALLCSNSALSCSWEMMVPNALQINLVLKSEKLRDYWSMPLLPKINFIPAKLPVSDVDALLLMHSLIWPYW